MFRPATRYAAETDMMNGDPLDELDEQAEQIARLRLTDKERAAIQTAMNAYGDNNDDRECEIIEATLWGLLERTK
jgi:hypothetical protein